MIRTKYSLYLLISLLIFLGAFLSGFWYVYAKSDNKREPIVETIKTKNGARVVVTLPEGYVGRVITKYDGKDFQTSTIPLTDEDIKKMNSQIEEQQKALRKIFEEQQKMFDALWKSFELRWQ